jgi:replicative DNA helicase
VMRAKWAELEARADRTWGTATGISRLDEHTMGMVPGQLWVLGARPGQGKTSLAQQIAEYVAERGGGDDAVVFSSQEMEFPELLVRALARTSGVSPRAIAQRKMDRASWDAYLEAERRVSSWPIAIDDEKRITPIKLRAKVRRQAAKLRERFPKSRLRLVVVDYIQLMLPNEQRRNSNRATDLGEITRDLKSLAGEFECTVLALSQLKRPEANKPPTVPTLFDYRDSGSIESDGDLLLGLHRPDQYMKPGENPTGICEVHVLKGRACGECAFELEFDGLLTRFGNVEAHNDRLWRQRNG